MVQTMQSIVQTMESIVQTRESILRTVESIVQTMECYHKYQDFNLYNLKLLTINQASFMTSFTTDLRELSPSKVPMTQTTTAASMSGSPVTLPVFCNSKLLSYGFV